VRFWVSPGKLIPLLTSPLSKHLFPPREVFPHRIYHIRQRLQSHRPRQSQIHNNANPDLEDERCPGGQSQEQDTVCSPTHNKREDKGRHEILPLFREAVVEQQFVRVGVDERADYPCHNHSHGHGIDTNRDGDCKHGDPDDLLHNFQPQEDVTAAESVDRLKIDRMNWPERIDRTEDLEERNTHEPFFGQQELDQGLCDGSKTGHGRED